MKFLCHVSHFRFLKPFIRRDYETVPTKMKLLQEIQAYPHRYKILYIFHGKKKEIVQRQFTIGKLLSVMSYSATLQCLSMCK